MEEGKTTVLSEATMPDGNVVYIQKWYQSRVIWVTLFALVSLFVKMVFKIDLGLNEDWSQFVNLVLFLLSGFGIFNNPQMAGDLFKIKAGE